MSRQNTSGFAPCMVAALTVASPALSRRTQGISVSPRPLLVHRLHNAERAIALGLQCPTLNVNSTH